MKISRNVSGSNTGFSFTATRAIWRFGFSVPLTSGGSKRPTASPKNPTRDMQDIKVACDVMFKLASNVTTES